MICNSISSGTAAQITSLASDSSFTEIRLDSLSLSAVEIADIFTTGSNLIATFRGENFTTPGRINSLKTAIRSGAAFVDIETEAPEHYIKDLINVAGEHDCRVIISYHNYSGTPQREDLQEIAERCLNQGGDIAKIAVTAETVKDTVNLISLYPFIKQPGDLIAIAMGEMGRISRIAAPYLGAPFTFTVPRDYPLTAPGQLYTDQMEEIAEILRCRK